MWGGYILKGLRKVMHRKMCPFCYIWGKKSVNRITELGISPLLKRNSEKKFLASLRNPISSFK